MTIFRYKNNKKLYVIHYVINGSFSCCNCGRGFGDPRCSPRYSATPYGHNSEILDHVNLEDFYIVGKA